MVQMTGKAFWIIGVGLFSRYVKGLTILDVLSECSIEPGNRFGLFHLCMSHTRRSREAGVRWPCSFRGYKKSLQQKFTGTESSQRKCTGKVDRESLQGVQNFNLSFAFCPLEIAPEDWKAFKDTFFWWNIVFLRCSRGDSLIYWQFTQIHFNYTQHVWCHVCQVSQVSVVFRALVDFRNRIVCLFLLLAGCTVFQMYQVFRRQANFQNLISFYSLGVRLSKCSEDC